MRSHSLRELSIEGGESILEKLPRFDFYDIKRVTRFTWSRDPSVDPQKPISDLDMAVEYTDPVDQSLTSIRLRCSCVRLLRLPELGGDFFVNEIEIEDISHDQIEDVRYRVKDFGESGFEILCKAIEISFNKSLT